MTERVYEKYAYKFAVLEQRIKQQRQVVAKLYCAVDLNEKLNEIERAELDRLYDLRRQASEALAVVKHVECGG